MDKVYTVTNSLSLMMTKGSQRDSIPKKKLSAPHYPKFVEDQNAEFSVKEKQHLPLQSLSIEAPSCLKVFFFFWKNLLIAHELFLILKDSSQIE